MADLRELLKHIENVSYTRFNGLEFDTRLRRRFVEGMAKGTFSSVLPQCIVEDIHSFAKEQLVLGIDQVVLAFETKSSGLAALLYEIQMVPEGVMFSAAQEIHVPRRSSSRALPSSFTCYPVLFIDVGNV